jgi:hypothetical protein
MSTTTTGAATGTTTATTTQNASTPSAEARVVIPDSTGTTLTTDVYGLFVGAFFVVLSLIVLFATGSILSVLVLWATVALVLTVMVYYGFMTIDQLLGTVAKEEKRVERKAQPAAPSSGGPLLGSEVFHVSDQAFTYDEAPAVCAAYGGELATLEQIMDAFASGAEWCSYGWSAGGMALYPTQRETWDRLQGEVDYGKRTRCGRPGVNGGYFDPTMKFGVNCFGIKPRGQFTPPAPVPGVDGKRFREMVNRFKEIMKGFTLDPYSRMEWSEYGNARATKEKFESGSGGVFEMFKQDFFTPYGVREHLEGGSQDYVEPVGETGLGQGASSLRGPYGLLGDKGEKGEKGDTGPAGPQGVPGAQGSIGPAGAQGNPGAPGDKGPKGDKGEKGDQGERGPAGTGSAGGVGPKGDKGEKGDRGADGPRGPQGAQGPQGQQGAQGPAGSNASVPRNLNVDSLKIGGWNINPVQNGTALKVQKDGTQNPVTITQSGRLFAAWPFDYNEGNPNDNATKIARGQMAEDWRSGY